ncbi:hypothetical protein MPSEU_000945500 [Mayamaea pseudoterrestris]|nr:hypothetical protein MPSEU_000945500 [Mayamaea pseudoterrestris]
MTAAPFSSSTSSASSSPHSPSSVAAHAFSTSKSNSMDGLTQQDHDDQLPSTLQGGAVRALVEPGRCQFDAEAKPARLLSRTQVSPTSYLLRFALPDQSQPLQLTTCACILAHMTQDDEQVVRPYTPVSTNAQVGSFDLLIKDYSDFGGVMSHYLCKVIQPSSSSSSSSSSEQGDGSDCVTFTHSDKNVKISAHDLIAKRHVVMIAGGTGINPMLQALHALLGGSDGPQRVTLLYGSKNVKDILAKELLDDWAKIHADRFHVEYVLSDEPEQSEWQGRRGFVDKDLLKEHLPEQPSNDIKVLVCGPPPMYDAICGPREEADNVKGVLAELGYKAEHVYKF